MPLFDGHCVGGFGYNGHLKNMNSSNPWTWDRKNGIPHNLHVTYAQGPCCFLCIVPILVYVLLKWARGSLTGHAQQQRPYDSGLSLVHKAMAPHSSTLAWKIPWMEEPGRLQSTLRVGHNWATSLSLFTFLHWRRKWQPTPVFLPGESQGRGSLVGCCLWGRTESDTTEVT